MLLKAYQLFFRTKQCVVFFFISITAYNALEYKYLKNYLAHSDSCTAFDFLAASLELSFYLYVIFLLLSYFYFSQLEQANMKQVVAFVYLQRIYTSFGIVLSGFAGMFCVCSLFWNLLAIYKVGNWTEELILRVILVCILYFFLFLFLGIAVGCVIANIEKRPLKIVMMALAIVLASTVPVFIANACGTLNNHIYDIVEWFQVGPRQLDGTVNPQRGISADWSRFALILLWIQLCGMYLLKKLHFRKRYFGLAMSMFVICCVSVWNAPWIGDVGMDAKKYAGAHYYYYYEINHTGEGGSDSETGSADFQVKSYKMDFSINNQLKAKVIMELDSKELSEYHFTLYHQYEVKKIYNEKGKTLSYKKQGDYITVYNSDKIEKITFEYKGSAASFITNRECTILPSEFCYYPQPGNRMLYDEKYGTLTVDNNRYDIDFDITIHSSREMYCNLNEKGKNHFQGKTTAVALYSGFLDTFKYKNVTVVYPYLDMKNRINTNDMKAFIDGLLDCENEGVYTIENKTIFAGLPVCYPEYVFSEDHVEVPYPILLQTTELYYENYLHTGKNTNQYLQENENIVR